MLRWEFNSDGSVSGRVYGKKGFKPGENMSTSIVPKNQRFDHYVVTTSGTLYRLGSRKLQLSVRNSRLMVRVGSNFSDFLEYLSMAAL